MIISPSVLLLAFLLNFCRNVSAVEVVLKEDDKDCQSNSTYHEQHRLECWLRNTLKIDIPNQRFHDVFTLSLESMQCESFELSNITSLQSVNSSSYELKVESLSATCHGNYHTTGGISGHLQASVASSPSNSALSADFELDSLLQNHLLVPNQFFTKACRTNVQVVSLQFSGSISAKVIQIFQKPIRHHITQALKQQVCPLLPQKVDPLLNLYLKKFNDWKEPYLNVSTILSTTNNATTDNPIEWRVPQTLLKYVDLFVQQFWHQGLIPFHKNACNRPDCEPFQKGLSGLIPTDIPFKQTLHLGSWGTVDLSALQLHGVDQIDTIQTTGIKNTNHSLLLTSTNVQLAIQQHPSSLMPPLIEVFDIALNLSSLQSTWSTMVQVTDWDSISVWQLLQQPKDSWWECLVNTIESVDLLSEWKTYLVVESLSLTPRSAETNTLEGDLDHVLTKTLYHVLHQYTDLWTRLGRGVLAGPIASTINERVEGWLQNHSKECPPSSLQNNGNHQWIDFTKWKFLYQFNTFLSQQMDILNHFLDCLSALLELLLQNALPSTISVQLSNWNSLHDVQLGQPQSPTTLNSQATWGSMDQLPQLLISTKLPSGSISVRVNATIFFNLQASALTQLEYDLQGLQNISLQALFQNGQCVITPASFVQLEPFLELPMLGMNISLESLDGNKTMQWSTVEENNSSLVPSILDWTIDWIRDWTNEAMQELVRGATCSTIHGQSSSRESKNNKYEWMQYPLLWGILMVMVLSQGGILWMTEQRRPSSSFPIDLVAPDVYEDEALQQPLLQPAQRNNNQLSSSDELLSLIVEPPSSSMIVTLEDQKDAIDHAILEDMRRLDQSLLVEALHDEDEDENHSSIMMALQIGNAMTTHGSLFQAKGIEKSIRFLIPMMVIGTIGLLVASNVSIGASVNMFLTLKAMTIELPELFQFSLASTIHEFYKAGIYPLLALVVVFSGIWPYAKLLWMLHAWFQPQQTAQRLNRLLLLDALSKFSLVDTYVLVVMVVAFRFSVDVSETLYLNVYVTPQFGFYAFLGATCLSLVLGHAMLYFHRRALRYQEKQQLTADFLEEISPRESILDHPFVVKGNTAKKRLSRSFQVFLFSCCLVALVFLHIGFHEQSFVLEFGGLAGAILDEQDDTSKRTTYSLVSLGAAISKSVRNPASLGILLLQAAFYFFAVVTPITCLLCFIILLLCPMTLSKQKKLLVAAEIANAWSAVEVFVLSICAALFQLSTFASFMLGKNCDMINRWMQDVMQEDMLPVIDDAVCFKVTASVDSNKAWYLVVGVLVNSFIVSVGLKLAHNAVEERSLSVQSFSIIGETSLQSVETANSFAKLLSTIPVIRSLVFES
jgi:hypothetical protein